MIISGGDFLHAITGVKCQAYPTMSRWLEFSILDVAGKTIKELAVLIDQTRMCHNMQEDHEEPRASFHFATVDGLALVKHNIDPFVSVILAIHYLIMQSKN